MFNQVSNNRHQLINKRCTKVYQEHPHHHRRDQRIFNLQVILLRKINVSCKRRRLVRQVQDLQAPLFQIVLLLLISRCQVTQLTRRIWGCKYHNNEDRELVVYYSMTIVSILKQAKALYSRASKLHQINQKQLRFLLKDEIITELLNDNPVVEAAAPFDLHKSEYFVETVYNNFVFSYDQSFNNFLIV